MKRRHLPWNLSIITWQPYEEHATNDPHEHGDWNRDRCDNMVMKYRRCYRDSDTAEFHYSTSPVSECCYVNLLRALYYTRAENPVFDRSAALVSKIEGEEQ